MLQSNDADADGDGLADVEDICPFDKTIAIRNFNFSISQLIDLSLLRFTILAAI